MVISMQTTVKWCDWSGNGLDYCSFLTNSESSVLDGVVTGSREGSYGAHYFVLTDACFLTREVRVEYVGGPRMHICTDGEGRWHDVIRNEPIPSLTGCLDVDIGVTPATNTLPIKRLKLAEQASQEIVVAYVPLPTQITGAFLPRIAQQRYTCLTLNQRYRYEGIFRKFTADLDLDRHGLVLDYPETFRRVHF